MLQIKNVEKYYGSKNNVTKALDRVSFDVEDGEFIAIMGASGSGKTTLLNCISTIDTVSAGEILLDEENIADLPSGVLAKFRRERLGFVFQDFNLLDTLTIEENIGLALALNHEDANGVKARVEEVAGKLGIADILGKFPYQVSGGQKQRLCIARALLKKPKILILDDSTSAVDTATEAKIRESFSGSLKDTTKLIIAQRISSIMHSDHIMVLEDGKIAGYGTHEELLEHCEIYREIRDSQM